MQLSRILGFSPDYLAKLQVANVSTDRDLADYLDLDGLSHETGIPAGVLKQLSELAEWNVEASSKRIRTLALGSRPRDRLAPHAFAVRRDVELTHRNAG